MTLEPVLTATVAIQIHVVAAVAAFGLGVVQFAGAKGTMNHRVRGWIWVGLMTVIAATSFWIHELRLWGPWSPIHVLSVFTLANLPWMVLAARGQNVTAHKYIAGGLFFGALVIAGLFTLVPGRIMNAVLFG